MADSMREKLMAGLLDRLREITTSNGYTFTLQTCERRHADLPDFPVMPAVFLYEGSEDKVKNGSRLLCRIELAVVYCAEANQNQATIGNRMLADITRAMGTDFVIQDASGYNFSIELDETSAEVIISETQNQMIYASSTFVASYYHEHGDQTRG